MTPFAVLAALVFAAAPWSAPLTPFSVHRPFEAPLGAYAPGHRGVDLAADPGQLVRAAGAGRVRAAGLVAGRPIVSIEHPHPILGRTGWRTTYVGVVATVGIGDRVEAGDVIGRVVTHSHGSGMHWGLRRGSTYADPLLLLRRPVVLKPLAR